MPVPSSSRGAKPLPPGPGPTELHVTLEHRRSKGPCAPLGAGTAGPAGRAKGGQGDPPSDLTPNGRGHTGALIALWGTQSTPPPQPSLLPQLPIQGTQRSSQSDGGGKVPLAFGCILTQGPSQSPRAMAQSLWGVGPRDHHP